MKTTMTTLGTHGFVCEIFDIDCGAFVASDVVRVKEALFEHRVLVIRDQQLSPRQYQDFMAAIGTPIHHVLQNLTLDGFPAILKISDYVAPDGTEFGVLDGGTYWHSDMSYLAKTGIATSLYAVNATARSGGTSFADLRYGWELVRGDAELLELLSCPGGAGILDLKVEHRFGNRHALRDTSAADQDLTPGQRDSLRPTRHLLVERHPVTRALSLFSTSGSAMAIVGMDQERSTRALDRLEEVLLAGLEVYTHRYRPGDLVLWDNMSTLHRGTGVKVTHRFDDSRLLYRINVDYAGESR
jgi:taurine dioxygenase